MGEPARRGGDGWGSSVMGDPVRRGGGDSFLSGVVTLLDSEPLTDRRFREVFKPVGGPNRIFEFALDERTTFGTCRNEIKCDLTGEGFSPSPLRFKRDADVETVGFTREIELVEPPLRSLEGTEMLPVVVAFCGDFENEVKCLNCTLTIIRR